MVIPRPDFGRGMFRRPAVHGGHRQRRSCPDAASLRSRLPVGAFPDRRAVRRRARLRCPARDHVPPDRGGAQALRPAAFFCLHPSAACLSKPSRTVGPSGSVPGCGLPPIRSPGRPPPYLCFFCVHSPGMLDTREFILYNSGRTIAALTGGKEGGSMRRCR